MRPVVFLLSQIMPYHVVVFKMLVRSGMTVHVTYLEEAIMVPYQPPEYAGISYYAKSTRSRMEWIKFLITLNPALMVVVGWSNRDYLIMSRKIRRDLRIPVISYMDTQFQGKVRQFLGIILSRFYIKPSFSHFWIPGVRQYEFARMLGYSKGRILFHSLTADTDLFLQVPMEVKSESYPRNFLYVGRLSKEKGLNLLMDAWNRIEDKQGWKLTLIGSGPMKEELSRARDVTVMDFMDQAELSKQAEAAGCFVLPSLFEPWGVVLHEFTAAGLPIICSDACGASTQFVEHGFNGFVFPSGKREGLSLRMLQVMKLTREKLLEMSARSRLLAIRITPEISAATLLALMESSTGDLRWQRNHKE